MKKNKPRLNRGKDISEDIIFRCEAGWCQFFTIAVWDWCSAKQNGEPLEYSLSIIAEPIGIIDRIRKAFELIIKGRVYDREIILSKEKINELRRILNKR